MLNILLWLLRNKFFPEPEIQPGGGGGGAQPIPPQGENLKKKFFGKKIFFFVFISRLPSLFGRELL